MIGEKMGKATPEVTPVTSEVTEPQYLYHASRRGNLNETGIKPSIAGVIKKDPEGEKVFMSSDPESAVGSVLSEERLKAEQGVSGFPYKGKGEIVVYRIKLPKGSYYQDPRSGDYIIKRSVKPEEIIDWKLRSQKFPEPTAIPKAPVTSGEDLLEDIDLSHLDLPEKAGVNRYQLSKKKPKRKARRDDFSDLTSLRGMRL